MFMNNRKRMIRKTETMMNLKTDPLDRLFRELEESRRDKRKPHEKVVDTTRDRAPEFYEGLQGAVSADPAADCRQGLEYLHRSEYGKAHACFLKAARAGSGEGQYRLGCLYLYGRGVYADYNLAECWFREAAGNGFATQAADALEILARFRENGDETE